MNLNSKIKSFTLTEMVVVMILTAIVISISLLVLTVIQKELKSIQRNYKNTTEVKALEQILWKDFNNAEVYYLKEKQELICVTPVCKVLYQFKDDFIIRNRDTLKLVISEKKVLLDMNEAIGVVDGIQLKFTKQFLNKELFIHKSKSASYYMNN